MEVYEIVELFTAGIITKEEARAKLKLDEVVAPAPTEVPATTTDSTIPVAAA